MTKENMMENAVKSYIEFVLMGDMKAAKAIKDAIVMAETFQK